MQDHIGLGLSCREDSDRVRPPLKRGRTRSLSSLQERPSKRSFVSPLTLRDFVAHKSTTSTGISQATLQAEDRTVDLTRVRNSSLFESTSPQFETPVTTVATKSENCQLPLQQVNDLSRKAHQLVLEQQEHIVAAQHLEKRLARGEKMYADLIRESLELHRSLEQRRREIARDKLDLEKQRSFADDKGNAIRDMTAEITLISTVNITSGSIKQELSSLPQQICGKSQE